MRVLEVERDEEELRMPLVMLLHVTRDQHEVLRRAENVEAAFAPLEEVRSRLTGWNPAYSAARLWVPPLLRRARLREVLDGCLRTLLRSDVPYSLRLPGELQETLEAAAELSGEEEDRTAVLCLTDEEDAGELDVRLLDLRRALDRGVGPPVLEAFPLSHYDVLCRWDGGGHPMVWGPEEVVARVYRDLTGREVSVTARGLDEVDALAAFLEEEPTSG